MSHGNGQHILRVAVLTGQDLESICQCISALLTVRQVCIAGILLDSEAAPFRRRLRNLRRNVRREGLSYLWFRAGRWVRDLLENAAARLVPKEAVWDLLRTSLPFRAFRLADFKELYGIPVLRVGNLNGFVATETLRRLDVDLGIVVGTRILKRSTFSIPRMGCVNLHKGRVPEYRGLPPGFWELYEGRSTAGITTHFVDDGLDSGDIINEDAVPVQQGESPETLKRKLDLGGAKLLARCVSDLAAGRAARRPQAPSKDRVRTSPTRRQRDELNRRLGLQSTWKEQWLYFVFKTLLYLAFYYCGLFHVVRTIRRIAGTSRGCVLLYHRVNELCEDELTTSPRRFAEHMELLKKYYSVISTSVLVRAVEGKQRLPKNCVVIHFDDCYRDVYTNASPILTQLGFPACYFVSSGYLGSTRRFPHDETCPFSMENLNPQDLIELTAKGFEVGSHTVNHVDLGQCSGEVAAQELLQSKQTLEAILGKPVTLFSYPFGRETNIRPEVPEQVQQAGYSAMFSAYGGYITKGSHPFDLPRCGASERFRALDLLLEIEGLSLGALRRRSKTIFKWFRHALRTATRAKLLMAP